MRAEPLIKKPEAEFSKAVGAFLAQRCSSEHAGGYRLVGKRVHEDEASRVPVPAVGVMKDRLRNPGA